MFETIKSKVQERFTLLSQHPLFTVNLDRDALVDAYLNALPEELRQEHTCNCCKSFLRQYGDVVAIIDDKIETLWDFEVEAPYNKVPAALSALVRAKPIDDIFVSDVQKLGTDSNVALNTGIRWTHFYYELPRNCVLSRGISADTVRGKAKTQQQVFKRALTELTVDSVDTVLDLIAQNSLYRGAEFKNLLVEFRRHQLASKDKDLDTYCWLEKGPVTGIRNSVIGSLLVDLSEGRDLESAVRAYEQKVAPSNYRRPTALVTKAMLDRAEKDLSELGLIDSLARRHATVDDIPVSEVLFVDRGVADKGTGLFDTLKDEAQVDPKAFSKIEAVPYDRFIAEVLPKATSLELLLENRHLNRFMNLSEAANPDAPGLFSWDNTVAWAYCDGNADSIKERVKAAGGNVTGDLRISLGWFNYDDLDLHVIEPRGNEIYFSNKVSGRTGGNLDVDMNAGTGKTREAVENIVYPNADRMLSGTYQVVVHNYCKRENSHVGFEVEIEFKGEVQVFSYTGAIRNGERVAVANITYSKHGDITITSTLPASQKSAPSKTAFGLNSQRFHWVSMVVPSPNYWTGKTFGNRHTFFILDGAKADMPVRGFFNEFLKSELSNHRKVFELLGSKTMIAPDGQQLAGLGFSSTQRDELICRVGGSFNRVIKVQF